MDKRVCITHGVSVSLSNNLVWALTDGSQYRISKDRLQCNDIDAKIVDVNHGKPVSF